MNLKHMSDNKHNANPNKKTTQDMKMQNIKHLEAYHVSGMHHPYLIRTIKRTPPPLVVVLLPFAAFSFLLLFLSFLRFFNRAPMISDLVYLIPEPSLLQSLLHVRCIFLGICFLIVYQLLALLKWLDLLVQYWHAMDYIVQLCLSCYIILRSIHMPMLSNCMVDILPLVEILGILPILGLS